MKTNSTTARTLITLIALIFAGSMNGWALSPRSRPVAGIVQSIDPEKHLITIVSARPGVPGALLWTRQTRFLADWHFTNADALKPAMPVVVHYQTPCFGKPFVTKVIWDNVSTRK